MGTPPPLPFETTTPHVLLHDSERRLHTKQQRHKHRSRDCTEPHQQWQSLLDRAFHFLTPHSPRRNEIVLRTPGTGTQDLIETVISTIQEPEVTEAGVAAVMARLQAYSDGINRLVETLPPEAANGNDGGVGVGRAGV